MRKPETGFACSAVPVGTRGVATAKDIGVTKIDTAGWNVVIDSVVFDLRPGRGNWTSAVSHEFGRRGENRVGG